MSILVFIVFAIFLFGLIVLSIVSGGSSPFAPLAKWLLVLFLGLAAMFCIYGFMASFEPGQNALAFRIGYGIGFFVFTGLAAWTLVRRSAAEKR